MVSPRIFLESERVLLELAQPAVEVLEHGTFTEEESDADCKVDECVGFEQERPDLLGCEVDLLCVCLRRNDN